FEVYRLGTQLTKAGLGFPQYSNDDKVIPALVELGYAPEDAQDYTVAACWEFIIPGKGKDITNISALNLPLMAERAVKKHLADSPDFETFFGCVEQEIREECDRIIAETDNVWFIPSPWLDMLMDEIKYRNYGIHGTGIASCADSLTAVREYVFDRKTVTPERLIAAMEKDFADDPELLHLLRYETPKMGCDDDGPDLMARRILDAFGGALKGRKNKQGGIWKGGTATAMYYLWHAAEVGATPDGRRKNEPFGTNYSPNLHASPKGPVSVIRSFTKQNFGSTPNGGPLTLEFAGSIFNREESIDKVAELVRYFIKRGGHQLQLNSVNPEAMKDAQLHPERHRALVVRIWGWSAYFVELDKEYQDHVIARQEYAV
ncbi:MAG: pyruvate formate-lyase, partial [Abditibacteriota bacterium]|nr:pyruvate formate-lyase [Abditibacteriota bacterium]